MGATATALVGFGLWLVLLTFAVVSVRLGPALSGKKPLNSFSPDGRDLDALGQRVTRAHANAYETFPAFVAIALGASLAGRLDLTDGTAMWVLWARIGQSLVHIASTSVPAVMVRATLFTAQLLILLYWSIQLLSA